MHSLALDVVLVRHGLTDWNESGRLMGRTDVALNERGRAQAEAVAEALRSLRLNAVLSSPQRRAQETAAAIARAQGVTVEASADLAEVWIGRWQGKTWEELRDDADARRHLEDRFGQPATLRRLRRTPVDAQLGAVDGGAAAPVVRVLREAAWRLSPVG